MKKCNVIVLSAGKIQHKNLSSAMIAEEGMLPVRGKPSVIWSIDSLIKNSYKNITVVVRENNKRLRKILKYYFENIEITLYDENLYYDSILSSIKQGLANADENLPTLILLGDSFINGEIPQTTNFVLTSDNIITSKQWCLISKDNEGNISGIFDKEKNIPVDDKEALVGCYSFSDTKLLIESLDKALKNNNKEISDIIKPYIEQIPIKAIKTTEWIDFGHVRGAVNARLALFNAREFNSISVDKVRGTISKTSAKKQKILDEVNWYQNLPKELSVIAPRVVDVNETPEKITLEMEMYGYSNLAELFLYGQNLLEDWIVILKSLFSLHKQMEKFTQDINTQEQEEIYINKTIERVNELKQDESFLELLNQKKITINNQEYENYAVFEKDLFAKIKTIINNKPNSIVHGDFCFSNILFDPMHFTFRLIDPRGRFLEQSIYGDPRYDIAKLRHSVVGHYDYIVGGLYKLTQNENEYNLEIFSSKFSRELADSFDKMIVENGFNLEEIKLIEALLFLTMIPYHSDDKKRQLAFYLIAVQKFNEVLAWERENLEFV